MLLSRSDITLPAPTLNPPPDAGIDTSSYVPTGLETFAQNLLPVLGIDPLSYFTNPVGPQAFGEDIRSKAGALADLIIQQRGNPPQNVLTRFSELFTRLTEWQWSSSDVAGASGDERLNVAILPSLLLESSGEEPMTMYVAKNASSLISYPTDAVASINHCRRSLGVLGTYANAGFGVASAIPGMVDVSETAPIVVSIGSFDDGGDRLVHIASADAWYARDLIPPSIYTDAQTVLSLAAGNTTAAGGWLSFRPFQSVGTISGIAEITSTITNFLEAIGAGVQGGADLILNFISMLEQRVREIQEVIRRIEVYLAIPLSIEIPDAVGLVIVGSGMDGVVSGLVSATNKPTDGPNAYAGGLVVLGGGVPAIITDLIMLLVASA
jgi:hypothetical protein